MTDQTVYNFSFTRPNGEALKLSTFKGKVLLIVNTASKCGFTKQYADLEALYNKYKDRGLVVLGVPSNDFGGQEPGSDAQIQEFCQVNFGITFPIVSKEMVKGKNAHPFYIWAKKQLGFGTAPKWNFHKYLVDRQGHLVDYFNTFTAPDSSKVERAIEHLLL
ncbi:MAG: glutathione peroxidase [Gammaproteobacteria bacterium]|nr:glutathione peroxidase [Gammaproteobacteria bacterium]